MKYFVVSDVHNNYTILKKTLDEKGFDENNDGHKLIICGDAFVYGEEAGKMLAYLQHLIELNRLIYIFGNHDLDLVKRIRSGKLDTVNRKTLVNILSLYGTEPDRLDDDKLCALCKETGVDAFIEDNTIPYFETDDYVFVHGFIPTAKRKYIDGWRSCDPGAFKSATKSDSMVLVLKYGIKENGKTIVAGHYSTARGYVMQNATKDDWENKKYKNIKNVPDSFFKPFYADGLILIDGSVTKTGRINCLIIEN